MRVAVDGETVFQYEGGFVGSRRPITGSFLCMVPLKAEYSGKTISVELTSPDRAALQVASPIRMGTAAEIRFTVFQSNRGVLLFSVAMVILMLISFGIYLFSRRYENRRDYQNFLFLGIFILLAMIWVLTDSTLGFLLSVNPAFIFLVSMVCFQLLPVPFLPVVWQNCGWDSRTLRLLQRLFWANCAAQGLLYFFDVFSYPRMLPVTHILLVLTIFYLLWRLVKDVKEKASASAKNLLGIVGIFSVFGLASLFIFSLGMRKDNSKLFRWGLLIFVVLLLGETWSKLIRLVQERIQMEVYKKMAYQDVPVSYTHLVCIYADSSKTCRCRRHFLLEAGERNRLPVDGRRKLPAMLKYIIKRLLLGVLVLFGTSILIFAIARVVPGDVATIALGSRATDSAKEALREELYLNDALPVQYVKWLRDVLHGNFGNSFITKRPVSDDVRQFLPATAELALVSGIFMIIGTFGLGLLAGRYKNTWVDGVIRVLSYVGIALPAFVVGTFLLLLFGYALPILPVLGRLSTGVTAPPDITGQMCIRDRLQSPSSIPTAWIRRRNIWRHPNTQIPIKTIP